MNARAVLARHSKSFSLAARLLPAECRDDAAVLYAWCRRADDHVDLNASATAREKLVELRAELSSVYRGEAQLDPLLRQFQSTTQRRGIPIEYPRALLDGLAMDLGDVRLRSLAELLLYAYRVAGVVGLMMCHVLGVRGRRAYSHAAHLGMAMQLTNICRDVQEDWARRRLYLPASILASSGAGTSCEDFGKPLPASARAPLARATLELVQVSHDYYRSGDEGLRELPLRAAFAVRTAGLVYAAIGEELARRRYDVLGGRVVVPGWKKLFLVLRAACGEALSRLRAIGGLDDRAPTLP
ncbi:MAG TPA: phytoene/squalene synthase family protein [Polyangiaceae bacterium]|nr:phytoene/squalene synthase family protein [Polyangiaceae bacterium]